MRKQYYSLLCAGLLILLFVYTGLSKLIRPDIMEMDLHKPEQPELLVALATPLSLIVPVVELIVAFLLFVNRFRKWGYYGALLLMTCFTIYVGYLLLFFPSIERPCTCGGIFRELSWETHFVVNIVFMGLAVMGILIEKGVDKPNISKSLSF